MIPEVSDKSKTAALPITIDLIKDMTIDNGISLLERETEALQCAITVSRTYTSAIVKPAAGPSNYKRRLHATTLVVSTSPEASQPKGHKKGPCVGPFSQSAVLRAHSDP
jgi:hypothetical protein